MRLTLLQAGPTRLELATSGVTGRRSNQLSYDPDLIDDCGLLIGEIGINNHQFMFALVGGTGFEPVAAGV